MAAVSIDGAPGVAVGRAATCVTATATEWVGQAEATVSAALITGVSAVWRRGNGRVTARATARGSAAGAITKAAGAAARVALIAVRTAGTGRCALATEAEGAETILVAVGIDNALRVTSETLLAGRRILVAPSARVSEVGGRMHIALAVVDAVLTAYLILVLRKADSDESRENNKSEHPVRVSAR